MYTIPFNNLNTAGVTAGAIDNSTNYATTAYVDRGQYLPTIVFFRDDFLHTGAASSVTTATGMFFDTNWSANVVSGGTSTQASTPGTWANPGQLLLTTPASSGQGITIYKGGNNTALGNLAAQGGWEVNIVLKIGQTANTCVRAGLFGAGQQAADAPTGGIYMEYDTANTGNTDTKFSWVTRSGGSPSYSTTNAINADTSFHHFRIRSVTAGTILYSVDGGTEASLAATVPTVILGPFVQIISRTAGAVTATVDFFSYVGATSRT